MADITPLPKSPSAAGCHVGGWSVAAGTHLPPRSGQGLAHLVVAGQRHSRSGCLEAAGVAVHDGRVDGAGGVVVRAEPHVDTGAHVVMDHVGPGDEVVQHRLAALVLEVDGDAALAPVAPERRARHRSIPLGDVVHLDHVGTEISEGLGAVGPGHGQAEVEHGDALQGVGQGAPGPVGPDDRRSGQDLGGVLARAGRRSGHPPRCARHPVDEPDLAGRPLVGIERPPLRSRRRASTGRADLPRAIAPVAPATPLPRTGAPTRRGRTWRRRRRCGGARRARRPAGRHTRTGAPVAGARPGRGGAARVRRRPPGRRRGEWAPTGGASGRRRTGRSPWDSADRSRGAGSRPGGGPGRAATSGRR